MVVSSSASISMAALLFLTTLLSNAVVSHQQPVLNPTEQESVYRVLESINPTYSWRSAYPDDLCSSAPYGVVCDYFLDDGGGDNATTQTETLYPHITELRFGYVSDYTPNPVCTHNSTFDPSLFTSFTYLRKLFFYQCFTQTQVSVPEIPSGFGSNLEELVFIDNPSLVSPLSGILGNFTNLRRVVLTGNGFYGNVPNILGELINLEEITVTANQLNGSVLTSFDNLKKLKVLDLSHSDFQGDVPDSIRRLTELLKLDLSYNRFTGKIPEGIKDLKRLELLDLSFNHFGNFGIPLFLGEMSSLREVHLSGNLLGGVIPEIWKNLGGILGLGLSNMGLVGNIPNSLGVHLRSLFYLGLDNNKLEGTVPMEFELLKNVGEVNLMNNLLSGKISFTGKMGKKLKLGGNPELCVDDGVVKTRNRESLGQLKICNKTSTPNPALLLHGGGSSSTVSSQLLMSLGFFWSFYIVLLN